MAVNDFDFVLGKGRRLQGRGAVGLVALGMVLLALVAIVAICTGNTGSILHQISALKIAF